jgi:hypothetical protein
MWNTLQFGVIYRSVELLVPGDCVAGNRGADFVKRLAPALCAGTRHLTRWLSLACAYGAASFAPRVSAAIV